MSGDGEHMTVGRVIALVGIATAATAINVAASELQERQILSERLRRDEAPTLVTKRAPRFDDPSRIARPVRRKGGF